MTLDRAIVSLPYGRLKRAYAQITLSVHIIKAVVKSSPENGHIDNLPISQISCEIWATAHIPAAAPSPDEEIPMSPLTTAPAGLYRVRRLSLILAGFTLGTGSIARAFCIGRRVKN